MKRPPTRLASALAELAAEVKRTCPDGLPALRIVQQEVAKLTAPQDDDAIEGLHELVSMAAAATGTRAGRVLGRSQTREVTAARHLAWAVLVSEDVQLRAIGAAFGRDFSAVHHGVKNFWERATTEDKARVGWLLAQRGGAKRAVS